MTQDPHPKPIGELGAAFAALVQNPPPSELTANLIIGTAAAQRQRRRNWVVGGAVAAVAVSVMAFVVPNLVGTPASSASAPVSATSASTAGSSSAAASIAVGGAAAESANAPAGPQAVPQGEAGGSATTKSAQSAGGASSAVSAASSTSADLQSCVNRLLTADQQAIVRSTLPGLTATEAVDCTVVDGSLVGFGHFAADAAHGSVEVWVSIWDTEVKACQAFSCTAVDGYPDTFEIDGTVPGPDSVEGVTVITLTDGSSVQVSVGPVPAGSPTPYSVPDLAAVTVKLAATR